jgi:hypothetical protein
MAGLAFAALTACTTRQVQDSLVGATAQQLVTHSIDDLVGRLPESDFAPHAGKRVHVASHFVEDLEVHRYAQRRLAVELARRFDMQVVEDTGMADIHLEVFYTALGTDQSSKGFSLPVGLVPGLDESTRIDLVTLDQFHGVAEMYYFLGTPGEARRGEVLQARTRSDAIGLPIIKIPISSIDRQGEGGD